MIMEFLENVLPSVIHIIEILGIFILVVGVIKAFYYYVLGMFKHNNYHVKLLLANSMAVALEFKMAGEILKTVIVHDFKEVAMIACIIVLRALLTFLIHFEVKSEKGEIEKPFLKKAVKDGINAETDADIKE